jgi:glycosyltransferase involved in cell wall biosynthesis
MAYGRTVRRLLAESWDVVHCWEEPYVTAGFQVALWTAPRVPFVFWSAQNLSKRYPPPFRWFERYCLRRCAGWQACGQTVVDALGPRGYAARPHRVLPLGVDLQVYRPDAAAGAAVRRALGWEVDGPPVVGYLGRFVPEKGLGVLTAGLDAQQTPWRALLVGGGKSETQLRTWAGKYADGRVRIVTGVAHDAVPTFLNAMDLLVAPSQTTPRWREQFGRMLIEAMACGVCVVGSDSGEIPFVIGEAGLVVGEVDLLGWTRALDELMNSPPRRAELAARGRERAATEYAWPVIARRHLEFYEAILDAGRDRSAGRPRGDAA